MKQATKFPIDPGQWKKLSGLIRDAKYCMLTTVERDGSMRSRPMYTQDLPRRGVLYFFTSDHSAKAKAVESTDSQVNLSYVSRDQNRFISVSGKARLVRDPLKMRELWKPYYKAWFPLGLEDPNLALLQVQADYAEYWETPPTLLVRLSGLIHALTGNGPGQLGKNEKLNLHSKLNPKRPTRNHHPRSH